MSSDVYALAAGKSFISTGKIRPRVSTPCLMMLQAAAFLKVTGK